ncbi:MAG: DUF1702 family protein [Phycisphaerales bacterium]|nr:DUF1702 family protein [Phycisphaerales bacterium]
MTQGLLIVVLSGGLVALVAVTGWWRYALLPWTIRTDRMTVRRLGLQVFDHADVERVDSILAGFAGGFNHMIARPASKAWEVYCASLPALLRPFAHEGAAMGYTIRHLFRYDPRGFESRIVRPRPEFRYLYYVGLGFWSGMRNHDARRVEGVADGLDPLHRYLCFDGYGFKHAFFDYPHDATSLRRLDSLTGYARNAAYQGVGRAFYFLFMARPDVLIERIRSLGDFAVEVVAGAGLAAAFINPDRLERARELARTLPTEWQSHFHLGLCFGLKARSINDLDQFDRDIASQPAAVQDAIRASVRECDRIELLVRADGEPDAYRRWRERVTDWMAENIEYPLARVAIRAGSVSDRTNRVGSVSDRAPSPLSEGGLREVGTASVSDRTNRGGSVSDRR